MSLGLLLLEEKLFWQMPMRMQTLQNEAIMSADINTEYLQFKATQIYLLQIFVYGLHISTTM